jgi:hypothetical protein
MTYVKLSPPANPSTDNTTVYVLERDEDGVVTKDVRVGVPTDVSKADQEKLGALGAKFEDSSADEAKKYEESQSSVVVGDDIAGAAPVFDQAPPSNASTTTPVQDSGSPSEADKASAGNKSSR